MGAFSRDVSLPSPAQVQRQQVSLFQSSQFSRSAMNVSGLFATRESGSEAPRVLTGFKASAAADRTAREAWQPSSGDRAPALDGKPGYTDLSRTLDQARADGRPVIATYGEIIFLGDKGVDARMQQRDVTNAIAAMEKSSTGRRLLRDLAGSKGLPVVVQLNNNRENEATRAESSGLGRPDGKGGLNPLNARNFDDVKWDPTTAFVGTNGISPPWVVLAHELRHAQQFAEERSKTRTRANPDGRIVDNTNLVADRDGNGVRDIEDNAVSIERRIMLQVGLTPARRTYGDPLRAIEVNGATAMSALDNAFS